MLTAFCGLASEETADKPWDDAEYFVESPDILTVSFAKPVRFFFGKSEILRENMSIHLVVMDVDATVTSHVLPIGPGGVVDLRELLYRKTARIVIGDLTLGEAEELIQSYFPDSKRVILAIVSDVGRQNANHLVEPDGFISLDQKRIYANGMTVKEIAEAIEQAFPACQQGSVSVSVFSYNSKEYYVIRKGAAEQGDAVWSFPCTEKSTVREALEAVQKDIELPPEKDRIWIARPVGNSDKPLMLPIDPHAVFSGARKPITASSPATGFLLIRARDKRKENR